MPNAFVPERNSGIMVNATAFEDRMTWAAGAFREVDDFGEGFSRDSEYNLTARVTAAPWYAQKGWRLLHLGLGYSRLFRANDEVRFRRGLVDAGAYSNLDWDEENNTPVSMKQDLQIFHQSQTFPRAIELVRRDLDPKIVARLTEVLLHIHTDPAAAEALTAYHRTTRFDELTDEIRTQLEEVRRIMHTIPPALR